MTDLRYPIGTFQFGSPNRAQWVGQVAKLPYELRSATARLQDRQLDTPYREGGWTVRQLVHHVADSHINSYIRFRLALTEDEPVIKPYEEALWAELADAKSDPIDISLTLLEGIHSRWVRLMSCLREEQWQRAFLHPVNGRTTLEYAVGLYAWHGRHHVAHVNNLKQRMGW